jgi:hypothetical protein
MEANSGPLENLSVTSSAKASGGVRGDRRRSTTYTAGTGFDKDKYSEGSEGKNEDALRRDQTAASLSKLSTKKDKAKKKKKEAKKLPYTVEQCQHFFGAFVDISHRAQNHSHHSAKYHSDDRANARRLIKVGRVLQTEVKMVEAVKATEELDSGDGSLGASGLTAAQSRKASAVDGAAGGGSGGGSAAPQAIFTEQSRWMFLFSDIIVLADSFESDRSGPVDDFVYHDHIEIDTNAVRVFPVVNIPAPADGEEDAEDEDVDGSSAEPVLRVKRLGSTLQISSEPRPQSSSSSSSSSSSLAASSLSSSTFRIVRQFPLDKKQLEDYPSGMAADAESLDSAGAQAYSAPAQSACQVTSSSYSSNSNSTSSRAPRVWTLMALDAEDDPTATSSSDNATTSTQQQPLQVARVGARGSTVQLTKAAAAPTQATAAPTKTPTTAGARAVWVDAVETACDLLGYDNNSLSTVGSSSSSSSLARSARADESYAAKPLQESHLSKLFDAETPDLPADEHSPSEAPVVRVVRSPSGATVKFSVTPSPKALALAEKEKEEGKDEEAESDGENRRSTVSVAATSEAKDEEAESDGDEGGEGDERESITGEVLQEHLPAAASLRGVLWKKGGFNRAWKERHCEYDHKTGAHSHLRSRLRSHSRPRTCMHSCLSAHLSPCSFFLAVCVPLSATGVVLY